MIENSLPITWQELQYKVNQIFCEIGLKSEVEKKLETPRGQVEVDVYAVDTNSIDQIKYIVECKNWSSAIPQSVVHSFTTVMHEIGGNIGYIIYKIGLQSGAVDYTKNTNITGLSFADFQIKYFEVWFRKYFCPKVAEWSDSLIQYTEPINSKRSRYIESLTSTEKEKFNRYYMEYSPFGMFLCLVGYPKVFKQVKNIEYMPESIELFKNHLAELGDEFELSSCNFRDLLKELKVIIDKYTSHFNELFGKDIFA